MKTYVVCGPAGVVDELEVSAALLVDEEMVLGATMTVVDVVDGRGRTTTDVDTTAALELEVRLVLILALEAALELDTGGFSRA